MNIPENLITDSRTHPACYAEGWAPGDTGIYHGPLCIDGDVTVVEWNPEKWMQDGCVGDFRFRKGLVPVYSARFPATVFWWVHPCQLKKPNTSDPRCEPGTSN